MEILDSNILLFRKAASTAVMKIIDNHASGLQLNDHTVQSYLDETEKETLTRFINEKIDPDMLDYFLLFKAESRPDLSSSMWKHFIDMDHFNKTSDFKNVMREKFSANITYSSVKLFHRGNVGYDAKNSLNILGDLHKFAYHIGASEDSEHDSSVEFPLQRVSVKLNRGDVLVAPGSISHPYIITHIINGKFKFLEAI